MEEDVYGGFCPGCGREFIDCVCCDQEVPKEPYKPKKPLTQKQKNLLFILTCALYVLGIGFICVHTVFFIVTGILLVIPYTVFNIISILKENIETQL